MVVRRLKRHENRSSTSPWGTREVKRLWTWRKTCNSRRPRMKQESRRFERWECQATSISQTRHYGQQFRRVNRLGDMGLVADGEGAQAIFPTPISREGDGRNMPAALALQRAQFFHQRVAVFPRHADVSYEYVWPPFVAGGQCLRHGDHGPHIRAALLEHHGCKFTRIGFVIHEQRTHTRERGRIFWRQSPARLLTQLTRRRGADRRDRQRDREGRAFAKPLARGANRPAVQFNYTTHDGESQSQSTLLAARPAVLLPEVFEDIWQKLRLDPLPVVCDDDLDVCVCALKPYLYTP